MSTATKTLYETDFVEWADHTAELLRQRKFDEIDLEHLVEEVEGLAGSDRHAVSAQLLRLMKHLVKQQIQPQRKGRSWIASINNARGEIQLRIDASPSLRVHARGALAKLYPRAVRDALEETGLAPQKDTLRIPERCPWSLEQLLEGDPEDLRWN
ncbi:MAG: DUF29 domain-containing protein [Acidobacteriia bacterium]|nr:DUF29 domain-containing protein [Terriglobia bacterium]MBV8905598.1 DUF29 domain-containing protein [Terriglobia bacterium]